MAVNEPYKLKILESIEEEPITIYHIGKFASSSSVLANLFMKHSEPAASIEKTCCSLIFLSYRK